MFMSKTRMTVHRAKYSHCESEQDLRDELIFQGYYIFPWQDAPGARYAPHQHHHDEFIIVQSGSIVFTIDGQEIRVEAGDMLVLPEGTQHSAENTSDLPVRYLICSKQ